MGSTDHGINTDEWMPMLYDELKRIAHRERLRVSGGETFVTTALVNELYLRIGEMAGAQDRQHFLSVAAVVIRRILVDRVRAQLAAKRGGGAAALPLDAAEDFVVEDEEEVLAVHEALEVLAEDRPRLARIVECRFFAGYDAAQTAEALGISKRTVERDWVTARAWLRRELRA